MAPVTRRFPHKHAIYGCRCGYPWGLWVILLDWTHEGKRREIIILVSASCYSLCSFPHSPLINWTQIEFNWFCHCGGHTEEIMSVEWCRFMSRKCTECSTLWPIKLGKNQIILSQHRLFVHTILNINYIINYIKSQNAQTLIMLEFSWLDTNRMLPLYVFFFNMIWRTSAVIIIFITWGRK